MGTTPEAVRVLANCQISVEVLLGCVEAQSQAADAGTRLLSLRDFVELALRCSKASETSATSSDLVRLQGEIGALGARMGKMEAMLRISSRRSSELLFQLYR